MVLRRAGRFLARDRVAARPGAVPVSGPSDADRRTAGRRTSPPSGSPLSGKPSGGRARAREVSPLTRTAEKILPPATSPTPTGGHRVGRVVHNRGGCPQIRGSGPLGRRTAAPWIRDFDLASLHSPAAAAGRPARPGHGGLRGPGDGSWRAPATPVMAAVPPPGRDALLRRPGHALRSRPSGRGPRRRAR